MIREPAAMLDHLDQAGPLGTSLRTAFEPVGSAAGELPRIVP